MPLSRRQVLAGLGAGAATLAVPALAAAKPRKKPPRARTFTDGVGMRDIAIVVGPPPSGPQVGSTLLFADTFASGAFTAWHSCQWNAGGSIRNDNCQTYNGTSDYSATVANGGTGHEQAARFELRDGDIPFSTTERAEIADGGNLTFGAGDERWFEWDMMFDAGFPSPHASSDWCIFWQIHSESQVASPPINLNILPNDQIWLSSDVSTDDQLIQTVVRGTWQHWILHVIHADSSAVGRGEVWIDGVQKVPWHNRRTMIVGETANNYHKMGIYRDPVNTATQILWYDNFKVWAP